MIDDPNVRNLQAENILLGTIVEDLRSRCAKEQEPPQPDAEASRLRQVEDTLLDIHEECKTARQALRKQTDALQRTQALLSDARRANAQL